MNEQAVLSAGLWVGIHLITTLLLALNVTRHRVLQGQGKVDESRMNQAVRAHGNNIEYVPAALIAVVLLALLGYEILWINLLGGILFLARVMHGYGMQVSTTGLPKTRFLGNIITWLIYLVLSTVLIVEYFVRVQ